MYKLRLLKKDFETGKTKAEANAPCVDIESKETADALVASGLFEIVKPADTSGDNDTAKLEGTSTTE